jgi:hypothetical protein
VGETTSIPRDYADLTAQVAATNSSPGQHIGITATSS